MPVPTSVVDPPFNIVRASHVTLDVSDLARSRAFYADTLGLHVEDETADAIYLRGLEERQHHSVVLRRAAAAACVAIGFKVASEDDLDKAARFAAARGLEHRFVEAPYRARTLRLVDPFGMPIELVHGYERREILLQKYGHYRGVHPQRLDHFNVFAPDVQGHMDFYAGLGFRVTEYAEEDGPGGRIAAAWMHRKGNVHDLAFTNGRGPRLHHVAYWVPTAMHIIHLCDLMATTGYLANMERGPARHGISNAFFLYVRDPDGHRIEIYTSDYQTMDPDHEPIRWSLRDPRRQTLWGTPAPRSWFEEGSAFAGAEQRDALFKAQVIVAG
ncbi:MAG: 3,4-dihydroxyphenylacetate 2,3-dioxygenase [Hyphomicrobiales bacterium]|nr:3,4-dihydroxyphenylacetate 2,3-dioxygenase [Hyphomicrobiales bacterium]